MRTKHKVIRVDNLMYNGCEPHWKCTICGTYIPFHCYTKAQIENMCCFCNKISCVGCDEKAEEEAAHKIIRRIDDLGRVSIPKNIRQQAQIEAGDALELIIKDGMVCFKKVKENEK